MKWWKGAFGLERDGSPPEAKSIIGSGPLGLWGNSSVSRQDGTNFRTNQVTLQQFDDSGGGIGNPLGLAATWACVNLIVGNGGSLPCMVYRTSNGVRTLARDHPLYFVLHDSPNFDQSAIDFFEFMLASVELQGNAYAEILRRDDGAVRGLVPIPPQLVTVERKPSGFLQYSWSEAGQRKVRDVLDILHVRGPMGNATSGLSTLAVCRTTFAGAASAEAAARSTFANGMHPSGVLESAEFFTPEQHIEARQLINDNYVGAMNSGRPMILDRGLKWNQLSINPEDAQLLDSRKFGGEEICRIFGVPPGMVGFGDSSSNWGTGKEVDVLGFIKFTLRRRLKRFEQALIKQLLSAADRSQGVTIEFNLEALLRGDSEGRSKFYQTMTQMGAMTINEVRALENLPPVPGGDVSRMQMQNVPITAAGQEAI